MHPRRLGMLLTSSILVAACSSAGSSISHESWAPLVSASPAIAASVAPSPAAAAPTGTAQPSPAVTSTPGKCLVVAAEYCGSAAMITLVGGQGENPATFTYVGLAVPAGSPIFAPASGTMSERAKQPTYDATGHEVDLPLLVIQAGPAAAPSAIWTLIVSRTLVQIAGTKVKEGAIVATASAAPVVGSYNVLILYAAPQGDNYVVDIAHLKALFGLR